MSMRATCTPRQVGRQVQAQKDELHDLVEAFAAPDWAICLIIFYLIFNHQMRVIFYSCQINAQFDIILKKSFLSSCAVRLCLELGNWPFAPGARRDPSPPVCSRFKLIGTVRIPYCER